MRMGVGFGAFVAVVVVPMVLVVDVAVFVLDRGMKAAIWRGSLAEIRWEKLLSNPQDRPAPSRSRGPCQESSPPCTAPAQATIVAPAKIAAAPRTSRRTRESPKKTMAIAIVKSVSVLARGAASPGNGCCGRTSEFNASDAAGLAGVLPLVCKGD